MKIISSVLQSVKTLCCRILAIFNIHYSETVIHQVAGDNSTQISIVSDGKSTIIHSNKQLKGH